MDKNLPTISILTMSYNPEPSLFVEFLESIKYQNYPKNKIEHLMMDGGSTNGIVEMAKKYGVDVYSDPNLKLEISKRQSMLLHKAKKDIVIWLETDNLFTEKNSLRKLIKPFTENEDLLASYSFHYSYNKNLPALDRYCALMGISDPVVYYLDKADRKPWFENKVKYPNPEQKEGYDLVVFNEENLPTVGDNGFLANRKLLLKGKTSPKFFFHVDIYLDVIRKGYDKFAVVYDTSIEHIIKSNFLKLIKRRIEYMERDSKPEMLKNRRYQIYDPTKKKDKLNLVLFVVFTLTLIQPILVSVKGFLKIRDFAWFAHPLMCWLFLIYYGKSRISYVFKFR